MTTPRWQDLEPILYEAAGLDERALDAWIENAPEEIRQHARALLMDGPEFGSLAAETAARIVESHRSPTR